NQEGRTKESFEATCCRRPDGVLSRVHSDPHKKTVSYDTLLFRERPGEMLRRHPDGLDRDNTIAISACSWHILK
ncbi:MAG: hypothetical protein ACOC24_04440, partial [Desulfovibrionales bacterium]